MKERILDVRRSSRTPVSTIVITAGNSSQGEQPDNLIHSPTLSNDTSDFLRSLSQNLADENDNLLEILRNCSSELKAMQGLVCDRNVHEDVGADISTNPVTAVTSDCSSIRLELNQIIQSLRDMVNQPDYVPLEELADRDEEIVQLKNRNGILEQEWRKALELVDMWNKIAQKKTDSGGIPSEVSGCELATGSTKIKKAPRPEWLDERQPTTGKSTVTGQQDRSINTICTENGTNLKRRRSSRNVSTYIIC